MHYVTIGTAEARGRLAHLLNEVAYGGRRYIIERRGQPLAAIIPAKEYTTLVEMLAEVGLAGKIHGIPVHIHFDGARYFVSDDLFDLYGEGTNLEVACQDYWLAVQDYLADLEADADQLAPYLAERLASLRALLANETVETKGNQA